jgi:hypothetical protein
MRHLVFVRLSFSVVITTPGLEIFLFCQRNSTGGGNLELRADYTYA